MKWLSKERTAFSDESDADSQSRLLDEETHVEKRLEHRRQQSNRLSCCSLVLLALGLSVISGFIGALLAHYYLQQNINSVCIQHTSKASPLLEDIEISYSNVRFNGSLLKENVYRQGAGPEVDAAWEALGVDASSVVVPAHLADRVGLAPDQVKIDQKYGGGFPANVEGLHQLHCLNLVRQALWYNWEYYQDQGRGPWSNSPYILRKHVSHCLDIVRQQLMCTIDIGVLGQVWFQSSSAEYPEAFVDFNTIHKCRNFEAVRDWALKHQIQEDVPDDFLEPPKEGDRIYHSIP